MIKPLKAIVLGAASVFAQPTVQAQCGTGIATVCIDSSVSGACDPVATATAFATGVVLMQESGASVSLAGDRMVVSPLVNGHTYVLHVPGSAPVRLELDPMTCFWDFDVHLDPTVIGDLNGDGHTTIDEIMQAVNAAMEDK